VRLAAARLAAARLAAAWPAGTWPAGAWPAVGLIGRRAQAGRLDDALDGALDQQFFLSDDQCHRWHPSRAGTAGPGRVS
jgi:hypothetical protein